MMTTTKEQRLAAADEALAAGDTVTAKIILEAVAYADRYAVLETAAHSVVNAYYAKWTRGDMRGPVSRLHEVLAEPPVEEPT